MVTLRQHIFDARDQILILDFLRRYSNECDAQGMRAHCALRRTGQIVSGFRPTAETIATVTVLSAVGLKSFTT